MTAPAKISVIIPCYNAARYIAATLRSVLAQEGVGLEVIVVDDGSTDGSANLVEAQFPTVQVLRQANRGVAAARNLGIERSRQEWVAFVDADDLWLPGKLRAQCEQLQKQSEARMCYSAWHVWVCDEPDPPPSLLADLAQRAGDAGRWAGPSGWIYTDLLLDCVVWTSTVVVERSLLTELGSFDESLRIGEDYDLWLRASRVTPILRLPRPCALYRLHPGNVTKRVPRANHRGEVVARALQRWGYASPDGRVASRTAVARSLGRSWSDFAGAQLSAGDLATARSAALQALRTDPRQWLALKVLAKAALQGLARTAEPKG